MQIPGCNIRTWMILTFYEPNQCDLSCWCSSLKFAHKFGKFEKTHVCNLKRFQVFAGLEELTEYFPNLCLGVAPKARVGGGFGGER